MNNRFQGRHQPGGSPRERMQTLDTEDEFRRRATAAAADQALLARALSLVNLQFLSATGVYVPHADMKYVEITGTAPGGGGGGADTDGTNGAVGVGGGGGAGETRHCLFTRAQVVAAIAAGATGVAVTFGAVGAGGAATGGSGGTGGDLTVGSLLTAKGGGGGSGSGTFALNSMNRSGGTGGTGGSGGTGTAGGDGGGGIAAACDGTTLTFSFGLGGHGGASYWGGGARSVPLAIQSISSDATQAAVNAGVCPGSGGAGAVCLNSVNGVTGSAGAPGLARFREFC